MFANRSKCSGTLFLGILAVLVFFNSLKNDFVGYDDQNLVVNNAAIRSLSPDNVARMFVPRARGNYQPVRTLSYAIDYSLWGLKPWGFLLTNIFLHAVGVVGVWFLLRHLLPKPVALLAAVLFAVHPVHVESVTWISSRKDVLSFAFFVLAILWYETSVSERKALPYVGSLLATALALLSKITTVVLPFCILLLEICRDGWPGVHGFRNKLVRLLPHFLFVAIVIGLNFLQEETVSSHGDALAGLEQVGRPIVRDMWFSMPLVVCRYLQMLVAPYGLITHYDVARISEMADPRFWGPMVFILAIILCGTMFFLLERRVIAFCVGWFFLTFLPASNIIPAAGLMMDRYMHIPSVGFAAFMAMVLAYPISHLHRRRSTTMRLAVVFPIIGVVLFLSVLTIRRNTDWRDTLTLFNRTLQINPRSVDARLAVGAMYHKSGDYDRAIQIYREALEIVPGNYRILYNLGVSFLEKGWVSKAIEALEEARDANPQFMATRFNLAFAYYQQRRYEEAIAEHHAVLRLNPENALSYGNLGRIYLQTGDTEKALEALNRALAIQPDLIPALMDRVRLLIEKSDYEKAERDIDRMKSLGVDTELLNELRRPVPEKGRFHSGGA